MHPKTVANKKGPGPFVALIHRKTELPMKINTARMTVGPASRYSPVMTVLNTGFATCWLRARLAKKIPRQAHLKKQVQLSWMIKIFIVIDLRPTHGDESHQYEFLLKHRNEGFRWRINECTCSYVYEHLDIKAYTLTDLSRSGSSPDERRVSDRGRTVKERSE